MDPEEQETGWGCGDGHNSTSGSPGDQEPHGGDQIPGDQGLDPTGTRAWGGGCVRDQVPGASPSRRRMPGRGAHPGDPQTRSRRIHTPPALTPSPSPRPPAPSPSERGWGGPGPPGSAAALLLIQGSFGFAAGRKRRNLPESAFVAQREGCARPAAAKVRGFYWGGGRGKPTGNRSRKTDTVCPAAPGGLSPGGGQSRGGRGHTRGGPASFRS